MKRSAAQSNKPATNNSREKLKLAYNTIKKGDVVANCKDDGFTQSEVNSNTQIHQKSCSPLSQDGEFRLDCNEPVMFSNIILSRFQKKNDATGQMENQVTLKTFMEVYGNYAQLDANGNHTTDEIGDSYSAAFNLIDESIAESIDQNPAHKKRILGRLELGKKLTAALDAPFIDMMEPFLKRSTIEDEKSEAFGEEDMSKSPTGAFQLWVGKPKTPSVDDLKIPGTDLVVWCRVYDNTERIASKPISTWQHLSKFIYEKGDSQAKGRRPFRFVATAVALAPSLYFNSEKKVGRCQYKIVELHIYQMDFPKARNMMSEEQMAVQQALKLKTMNRFVINAQPETNDEDEQQQQTNPYQQQQDQQHDQGYEQQHQDPDYDYDALIEEDQELQRATKKVRSTA